MEEAGNPICTLLPPRTSASDDEPSKGAFTVTSDLKSLHLKWALETPPLRGSKEETVSLFGLGVASSALGAGLLGPDSN